MLVKNSFWLIAVLIIVQKIFFCEAIVCYKCDSISLEACAISLNETELPFVECKDTLQCVMSIVDSITYRGCASSTPTLSATYKKYCPENLCNKGVYPPGRLKCHHCNGAECVLKPEGKPHPCRFHQEVDQCYTDVIDENLVYRGCSSDTNHTIIGDVDYCMINGCNDRIAATILKCAQCDSKNGLGCKMDLFEINANDCNITQYEICEIASLLTRKGSCYLYHNLNRIVRGCSKDIPAELKHDKAHLKECHEKDLCNAKCMKQQKCLVCESSKDDWCRNEFIQAPVNICGSAEASSCYACEYTNWQVERGCGAPPQNRTDVNRCYECDDADDCNALPLTRCYKCSTAVNANCANWDRPEFNIEIEECVRPGSACVMATLNNGITVRGCESNSLYCNSTLISCRTCQGSFCNKGPYPPDSLHCHQCEGSIDECSTIIQDPLPCPHLAEIPLSEREACFEYYKLQHGMIRSCRSNSAEYYQCMLQNESGTCRLCYEHGCNNSPAISAPTLECYHCDNSNLNCQLDQSISSNLKLCQTPVPFGHKESCFITRHIDGTTSRGCTLDQSDIVLQTPFDQTNYCSSNACNAPATISQFCINCTADLREPFNSTCISKPNSFSPHLCSGSSVGCFTLFEGAQLTRGCISDSPLLNKCQSQQLPKCQICHGQVCNEEINTPAYALTIYVKNEASLIVKKRVLILVYVVFLIICTKL